jgi:hypothetical protein
MPELSPQAQVIWNTYIEGYSEALCIPVDQFDTSMDCYSRKILASVLRALTCAGLSKETMIDGWVCKAIDVETILDVAAELEQV